MAGLNNKILLAEGDSWTAGDIIDPALGLDLSYVNDPRNNDYRLPRVWPHKLAKRLRVDVKNSSSAGSSNQGILNRTMCSVHELLKTYKPEDIYVIVGWSSPERKDFFYRDIDNKHQAHWDTLYPAELSHEFSHPGKTEFYKNYVQYFWNAEDYILRFINQNIQLHSYLKSLNIQHTFFNAFYEPYAGVIDTDFSFMVATNLYSSILETIDDPSYYRGYMDPADPVFFKEFLKQMMNTVIFDDTFSSLIKTLREQYPDDKLIENFHPSEFSHGQWSKYLYRNLKGLKQWAM